MTFFFSRSFSHLASLPTVVVLPAPCKPAIKITAGGSTFRFSGSASPPITLVSSSRTILIKACPGFSAELTS